MPNSESEKNINAITAKRRLIGASFARPTIGQCRYNATQQINGWRFFIDSRKTGSGPAIRTGTREFRTVKKRKHVTALPKIQKFF